MVVDASRLRICSGSWLRCSRAMNSFRRNCAIFLSRVFVLMDLGLPVAGLLNLMR